MREPISRRNATSARRIFGRAWGPAVLFTYSTIFLMAGGAPGDDVRGSDRTGISQHVLASSSAERAPDGIDVASPPNASSAIAGEESPFPVLPLAAAGFIAMTLACHLAAWRLAHWLA